MTVFVLYCCMTHQETLLGEGTFLLDPARYVLSISTIIRRFYLEWRVSSIGIVTCSNITGACHHFPGAMSIICNANNGHIVSIGGIFNLETETMRANSFHGM